MQSINQKNTISHFERVNAAENNKEGEAKQKRSGGYNSKRIRYGRTADSSGKQHRNTR
jgi:hypothetical protein